MTRLTWQTVMTVSVAATTIALQLSSASNGSDDATCSEAVCARVVTKCLLTEHCKCNFADSNYTCHKICFSCLAELCYDCCSCFGMCPKVTSSNPLNKVSSIEELDEPIPQLFEIYTGEGGDDQVPPRYTSLSFEQEKTLKGPSGDEQVVVRRNCSVAYTTKCTTSEECKTMCKNMGSSFSRWFHDGCCECVGDRCFDYGLAEARCANCPPPVEEHLDKDDFYYGEDDDNDDDGFIVDETDVGHDVWTTNVTYKHEKLKAAWKDPEKHDWDS